MMEGFQSGLSSQANTEGVISDLVKQFQGCEPKAIVFFASHHHDGSAISGGLHKKFPAAEVIGCTTAGEFTELHGGVRSVSALAMPSSKVRRCAGAIARFEPGIEGSVKAALGRISGKLEVDLRNADPKKYVGVVLIEGLRMKEELANEALGNEAPLLSFVGGSAGDNLEFKETRVFFNGEASNDGCALLLLEAAVPFVVAKTCSFRSTGKKFKVTKADVPNRVVHELDGRPVLEVYAEAAGVSKDKLDGAVFMKKPMGLMIDNAPWIRSPQQVLPTGGLKFYCKILEGMEIHLMEATQLVDDTRKALAKAAKDLNAPVSGGLVFNCILRRLELDSDKLHQPFLESFAGKKIAGFHTYGESYLGHINQTLTSLLFS